MKLRQEVKTLIPLALILVISAFLRTYKLNSLMAFTNLQGSEFITAQSALNNQEIPVSGIESAVSGIQTGPIYIWLLSLMFKLFGARPEPVALLAAIIGIITTWLLYVLAEEYWGKSAAIVSSLLFATSPLAIVYTRIPSHTFLVPLISLLYFASLIKLVNSNKKQLKLTLIIASILFVLLLQIKLTSAFLFLLIPLAFTVAAKRISQENQASKALTKIYKQIKSPQAILIILAILILPFTPRFLSELSGKSQELETLSTIFSQKINVFVSQFPLGVTLTTSLIYENLIKAISWGSQPMAITILVISVLLSYQRIKEHKSRLKPQIVILFSYLAVLALSFYFFGSISEIQFLLALPIVLLWIGWAFASNVYSAKALRFAIVSILFISLFNSVFMVSESFLLKVPKTPSRHPFQTYSIPIIEQQRIIDKIVSDSHGQPFTIESGDDDANQLMNLRFLIRRDQANLTDDSKLIYTVFNKTSAYRQPKIRIFLFNGAAVIRDEPKPQT